MSLTRLLPMTLLLVSLAACDTLPQRAGTTTSGAIVTGAAQAGPGAQRQPQCHRLDADLGRVPPDRRPDLARRPAAAGRAIKTPSWDALTKEDRAKPAAGLPMAVIVDIDETMLDNTPYGARLVRDGKSHDEAAFNQWVNEAAAKPVPGALEFARAANARGVTIFYISNRTADQAGPTVDNLRKLGFPIKDAGQYLGKNTTLGGCENSGSDKGCRRQLVGRTHRVLMQFGDQLGDLVSIASNTPAGREQAVRPYLGWVGERWFMLPNPSYGSWEPALFNNDPSQPEAVRRQQKLNALRY